MSPAGSALVFLVVTTVAIGDIPAVIADEPRCSQLIVLVQGSDSTRRVSGAKVSVFTSSTTSVEATTNQDGKAKVTWPGLVKVEIQVVKANWKTFGQFYDLGEIKTDSQGPSCTVVVKLEEKPSSGPSSVLPPR